MEHSEVSVGRGRGLTGRGVEYVPIYLKDGKRILHIHVPKTAGTSLQSFFGSNGFHVDWYDQGGETSLLPVLRCSRQHMHATMLKETLSLTKFDYVFMTTRHPITRMISEYRMRRSINPGVPDFSSWAHSIMTRPCGQTGPGARAVETAWTVQPQVATWVTR